MKFFNGFGKAAADGREMLAQRAVEALVRKKVPQAVALKSTIGKRPVELWNTIVGKQPMKKVAGLALKKNLAHLRRYRKEYIGAVGAAGSVTAGTAGVMNLGRSKERK